MISPAKGETVDIPAREVEIGRFDLIEMTGEGDSVFEIECGKGTYVRSLARDMGRDLGCFGHISDLRRTEVEPFTVEDFVTIAELEAARFGENGAAGVETERTDRRRGFRRNRRVAGRNGRGAGLPAAGRH